MVSVEGWQHHQRYRTTTHRRKQLGAWIQTHKLQSVSKSAVRMSNQAERQRGGGYGGTSGTTSESGGAAAVIFAADGRLMKRMPLGAVVTDAVRRWYLETEREASRGDVVCVVDGGDDAVTVVAAVTVTVVAAVTVTVVAAVTVTVVAAVTVTVLDVIFCSCCCCGCSCAVCM